MNYLWLDQIPICASTGGLVDTVKEGYTGFHMGAFSVEVCHNIFFFQDVYVVIVVSMVAVCRG